MKRRDFLGAMSVALAAAGLDWSAPFPQRIGTLTVFKKLMVNATDATPATGLDLEIYVSVDGGTFTSATNDAEELGDGKYLIALTKEECDGDMVYVVAQAPGVMMDSFTYLPLRNRAIGL